MPFSITEPSITITTPLRCLVVDNDPVSVQTVRTCIGTTPFLQASAACSSAIEAAELLRHQTFDVLFLDVEMPLMSGLDLLRTLPDPPQVVLITSSRSYAVQAFEFAVTDYLLKPLAYPRFLQAAQKVLENITAQRAAPAEVDLLPSSNSAGFIFVKVDNKLVRVDFADVFFVEALGDYVHFVTSRGKLIVYSTMRAIEEKFPAQRFVRVHRSFIINIDYVQALEDNSLLMKDKYIPIGQTYMRSLVQRLNRL